MIANAPLVATILVVLSQSPAEDGSEQRANRSAIWNAHFDHAAEGYGIYRDLAHEQKLELRPKPIYKWAAPAAADGIFGAVYVWTYKGCAENVVCFWRSVQGNQITLVHELHSLSPVQLNPARTGTHIWKPTDGLTRRAVEGAPAPAQMSSARLIQMRRLADAFSAHTEAPGDRRELRLLSTPLYRYESTNPEVIDGALFAFVCTAGTDPEAFLLIEARQTNDGPRWHYAIARFSHLDTVVSYDGKQVWKAQRGLNDTIFHNADYTYLMFSEPAPEPSNVANRVGRAE